MAMNEHMTITTDIFVIGSEGAGASAAIEAAQMGMSVLVATKGSDIGRSGSTVNLDGDMSCDSRSIYEILKLPESDPADNKEVFFEDIVKGGKFLNDQKLVEIFVEGAPKAVQELTSWGVKFNKVYRASGHRYPRGLAFPGHRLVPLLRKVFYKSGAKILPYTMITDLITKDGLCVGCIGLNMQTGRIIIVKAKAVILATGGGQGIYPITTSPQELTGDGQAIAFRAGAKLINMEFPQFIPGVFLEPPAVRGVLVPFTLSGAGFIHGWLLNNRGERYMQRWDSTRMEHSTRDVLSVAMASEIKEGRGSPNGGVYVSLSHLPKNLIENLGNVLPPSWYLEYGGLKMKDYIPNLSTTALEVCPGCHYFNGGVKIGGNCDTNVGGLFAAGEVTGGVQGANRLSGNSFTEIFVFGKRVGASAASYSKQIRLFDVDNEDVNELKDRIMKPFIRRGSENPFKLRKELQSLALMKVGVIRDKPGLMEALTQLKEIRSRVREIGLKNRSPIYNREWICSLELENMALILEFVITGSLLREESRGSLYRRDFPKTDNDHWLNVVTIKKKEQNIKSYLEPITTTKVYPPVGVYEYGYF